MHIPHFEKVTLSQYETRTVAQFRERKSTSLIIVQVTKCPGGNKVGKEIASNSQNTLKPRFPPLVLVAAVIKQSGPSVTMCLVASMALRTIVQVSVLSFRRLFFPTGRPLVKFTRLLQGKLPSWGPRLETGL